MMRVIITLIFGLFTFSGCSKPESDYSHFYRARLLERLEDLNTALMVDKTEYRVRLMDEFLFRIFLIDPDGFGNVALRLQFGISEIGFSGDPSGLDELIKSGSIRFFKRGGWLYFSCSETGAVVDVFWINGGFYERFKSIEDFSFLVYLYNEEKALALGVNEGYL